MLSGALSKHVMNTDWLLIITTFGKMMNSHVVRVPPMDEMLSKDVRPEPPQLHVCFELLSF